MLEQAGFPVSGLLVTHADWDHLLGRIAFPQASLGCGESTARAAGRRARRRPARVAGVRRGPVHRRSRPARAGRRPAAARSRAPVARSRRSRARAASGGRPHGGRHRVPRPVARRPGLRRLPVAGRDPVDLARRVGGRLPGDARALPRPDRTRTTRSSPGTAARSSQNRPPGSSTRTSRISRRCAWTASRRPCHRAGEPTPNAGFTPKTRSGHLRYGRHELLGPRHRRDRARRAGRGRRRDRRRPVVRGTPAAGREGAARVPRRARVRDRGHIRRRRDEREQPSDAHAADAGARVGSGADRAVADGALHDLGLHASSGSTARSRPT